MAEKCQNPNNVYYSVENNTLGEAALISLEEYGEQNLNGVFLSGPRVKGNSRRYRKGFNTTNTKKLSACAKAKTLIELGQRDCDRRWKLYSQLAKMDY